MNSQGPSSFEGQKKTANSVPSADLIQLFRFASDNAGPIVFWTDVDGNFVEVNEPTCKLFGYTREQLLQMSVPDIDPEVTQATRQELLKRLEVEPQVVLQSHPLRRNEPARTIEFVVKKYVIEGKVWLCAFGYEIDLEKQSRQKVLESIASGDPLPATLNLINELAEKTRYGMISSIMVMDDLGLLRVVGSPNLSAEYCLAIDGLKPGPAVGSCGAAAYYGKDKIVEDISTSPNWEPIRELAAKENLRACWSTPIFSSDQKVIGTLALYFSRVMAPRETDYELMQSFSWLTSIAIEKSQEQQKIQKSELRYRSLVQTSAASIWTTSPTGEFVAPQESWESYTGQAWEAQAGFGWTQMIHEDDREHLIEDWNRALETESIYRSQGRVWHAASESFRHFEAYGVPVKIAGKVVEWVGCTTDTQDLRLADRALKKNERKLRMITDSLPVFICYIDHEYRYQFNNAKYEKAFGIALEDLVGLHVREVIGESEFDKIKPHLDSALTGKTIKFENMLASDANGRTRFLECRFVPDINSDGVVAGVYGLVFDISDRRALEKEALTAAATEQRRIGRDLHDGIGQELTGLGMISNAMEVAIGESNPKAKFIAEKISAGIKRSMQQIRMLARGLNPVDISPDGIRSALMEMSTHVKDLYGIECKVDCPLAFELHDDQVATNLFRIAQEATTNAAKHSKASVVRINLIKTSRETLLCIQDNGCGFATTSQHDGMGLKTMRYRANAIGGLLEIASNESTGTDICCRIPNFFQ